MKGAFAVQDSRKSHHQYPFTLGGETEGGVVSTVTAVVGAELGLLEFPTLSVATATIW
jgi:hypothetical protein